MHLAWSFSFPLSISICFLKYRRNVKYTQTRNKDTKVRGALTARSARLPGWAQHKAAKRSATRLSAARWPGWLIGRQVGPVDRLVDWLGLVGHWWLVRPVVVCGVWWWLRQLCRSSRSFFHNERSLSSSVFLFSLFLSISFLRCI